ncbi:MAG: (d)CMP kinase [Solirubrobacteraceae bacterium]
MVIAIDGPAGAGKSSVARAAAERLGYTYLDTGAMYRAVAYWATTNDRDPAQVARECQVEVGERVVLDGHDLTLQIREPWVSDAASRVSADPVVREALVAQQKRILSTGDWVAEGRDIGTVVAPDAVVKVFLTADPLERARRRAAEQGTDAATVLADLTERDARDSGRAHAPLVPAADAVPVDSTGLSLDEVVAQILTLAVEVLEIDAEAP